MLPQQVPLFRAAGAGLECSCGHFGFFSDMLGMTCSRTASFRFAAVHMSSGWRGDDYLNIEARCFAMMLAGSCGASCPGCASISSILRSSASIALATPESVAAAAYACVQHVMMNIR